MNSEEIRLPIDSDKLTDYQEKRFRLYGLCCFGVGLLLVMVLLPLGLRAAIRRWARTFKCTLDENELSVYSHFTWDRFTLLRVEKSIPLEKITDVKLIQGPLLQCMGLWNLHIQTAGTGTARPEAVLYGLEKPHECRDRILNAIRMRRGS